MERGRIYDLINAERARQDAKWGQRFDDLNTPNDWVAYIAKFLGRAVTLPWHLLTFRTAMVQVAALAVAVLEREQYAPRHYDKEILS